MSVTGRRKRLSVVRDTVGHWQWAYRNSRVIECALAMLRIVHAGVKHHLNRFGMANTDCCSCGAVETIDHYLLSCSNYSLSRNTLRNALKTINVEFSLRNVLGGGNFPPEKQLIILKYVAVFLFSTGKIMEL